jgi:hypothetical protein
MKKKTFDCVKMKQDIQQEIVKETAHMSAEEKRRWTENLILSDPILARIWKSARRTQTGISSLAKKQ